MNIVKNHLLQAREVIFEPGNCTRYHLVLTQIRKDTLAIADINREKTILVNPQFVTKEEFYYAFYGRGYGESDAEAIANFLANELGTEVISELA